MLASDSPFHPVCQCPPGTRLTTGFATERSLAVLKQEKIAGKNDVIINCGSGKEKPVEALGRGWGILIVFAAAATASAEFFVAGDSTLLRNNYLTKFKF